MKIAIHQPSLFPHLAFFGKMEMADLFVVLGFCQFEKNNYQNRFQYREKWYTMSVSKKIGTIIEKAYLEPDKDWAKIKRRLNNIDLSDFDFCIRKSLYFSNFEIIKRIAKLMKINTVIYRDFITTKTGTERLIDICSIFNADEYISGPSGKDYLDLSLFDKAGIKVTFQKPSKSIPILEVIK